MRKAKHFTCHQCGEKKEVNQSGGTGYAIDRNDKKICYACCGENDRKELETLPVGGKTILYLDTKEMKLTNWPGTLQIKLHYIRKGRHNIAGRRYDVWFSYGQNQFHGTQHGDQTQICHIKRIKA